MKNMLIQANKLSYNDTIKYSKVKPSLQLNILPDLDHVSSDHQLRIYNDARQPVTQL